MRSLLRQQFKWCTTAFNPSISVTHSSNNKLTQTEKFLLQWYWQLMHPKYDKLISSFCSGVLSSTESLHQMIKSGSFPVRLVSKCTACVFRGPCRFTNPDFATRAIQDKHNTIKQDNLSFAAISCFDCASNNSLFYFKSKTEQHINSCCGGLIPDNHATNCMNVIVKGCPSDEDSSFLC